MKVLALDFDGVIADSQYECLFVGFNSYLKLNKNTRLFDHKKFTFNNFGNIKNKYNKKQVIELGYFHINYLARKKIVKFNFLKNLCLFSFQKLENQCGLSYAE